MISNNSSNLNLSFHPPNPCLLLLPRSVMLSPSPFPSRMPWFPKGMDTQCYPLTVAEVMRRWVTMTTGCWRSTYSTNAAKRSWNPCMGPTRWRYAQFIFLTLYLDVWGVCTLHYTLTSEVRSLYITPWRLKYTHFTLHLDVWSTLTLCYILPSEVVALYITPWRLKYTLFTLHLDVWSTLTLHYTLTSEVVALYITPRRLKHTHFTLHLDVWSSLTLYYIYTSEVVAHYITPWHLKYITLHYIFMSEARSLYITSWYLKWLHFTLHLDV